jgi:lipoyl-dependent peroxiredoxin
MYSVITKNMKYTAQALWEGSLKKGKGTLQTHRGIVNKAKGFLKNYFEEETIDSNPEELLAATHAGCFTMAVCSNLTKRGFDPNLLNTEATVITDGTKIKRIHLFIKGLVNNIDEDEFAAIAKYEERNCIISKALHVQISTEARLIV